ncbi:phosphonate ABC transporter substrate-binding protein [Taklimakanibacter deserti]|uniref:phosphonate ABC transporter substrate-binding protein n=1 Tax=Taklimakanibacter deserti TaxID=2267839 RepID=UPI000E64AE71
MRWISRRLAVFAAASMFMAGTAYAETKEINFGIISTESTQNLKQYWTPFLADLEKETGIKINPFFASDYAGIIEGMRFGKVQVAWYGNKAAMEAVDRAEGEVFAQSVDAEGNPGYWSLLVTNVDNANINTVDDVLKCDKSLSFGNGDPNSTSGFLVPSVFVFGAKSVDPKTCYKTVTNANHETNLMAVVNKQVDFATNNTENLRNFAKSHPDELKKIKEVWRSPLIPSDPIVWRRDLDQEAKDKILSFFMTYGRQGSVDQVKAARENLKKLNWAPFKPSSDAQLYPIRVLEISKAMNKVKADEALSQADKDAKIKELEAKKAEFEKLMAEVPQT